MAGQLRVTFSGEIYQHHFQRNKAMVTAHLEYGYSLSELARYLGLQYTTISKVVRQHSQ